VPTVGGYPRFDGCQGCLAAGTGGVAVLFARRVRLAVLAPSRALRRDGARGHCARVDCVTPGLGSHCVRVAGGAPREGRLRCGIRPIRLRRRCCGRWSPASGPRGSVGVLASTGSDWFERVTPRRCPAASSGSPTRWVTACTSCRPAGRPGAAARSSPARRCRRRLARCRRHRRARRRVALLCPVRPEAAGVRAAGHGADAPGHRRRQPGGGGRHRRRPRAHRADHPQLADSVSLPAPRGSPSTRRGTCCTWRCQPAIRCWSTRPACCATAPRRSAPSRRCSSPTPPRPTPRNGDLVVAGQPPACCRSSPTPTSRARRRATSCPAAAVSRPVQPSLPGGLSGPRPVAGLRVRSLRRPPPLFGGPS